MDEPAQQSDAGSGEPERPKARFRPHERVREREVFQRTFAQRRAVSDATLVVHALRNGRAHSRLGVSVPRRVTRQAVVRNRLKRLIREAFRLHKAELPLGFDLIVVPRRGDLKAAAVAESLVRLAADAARRALPRPVPPAPEPPS